MTRLYTINGCDSCRRIKRYFKENGLSCEEISLYKTLADEQAAKTLQEWLQENEPEYVRRLQAFETSHPASGIQDHPCLIEKPVICDQTPLKEHLQSLARTACQPKCSAYETCKKALLYWDEAAGSRDKKQ